VVHGVATPFIAGLTMGRLGVVSNIALNLGTLAALVPSHVGLLPSCLKSILLAGNHNANSIIKHRIRVEHSFTYMS
jgi:hypothetical protein